MDAGNFIFILFPRASKVPQIFSASNVWRAFRPYDFRPSRLLRLPAIWSSLPHLRQQSIQTATCGGVSACWRPAARLGFLNQRARLVRVGTIDATLARFGPQNGMTIRALVKKLTLIRGHRLSRPEVTMRTRDCRGQFGHAVWTNHVIGAGRKRIQEIPFPLSIAVG